MSKYIDFYLIGELVDSHGNIHYEDLKNLQTADVVERKHGKWLRKTFGGYSIVQCSVCRSVFLENNGKWNFCPNCGTRM